MKLRTALACTAALALSATAASAAVVCNDEGDCWRVKERRDYAPDLKLHIYDDDWKWKEGESIAGGSLDPDTDTTGAVSGSASTDIVAALLIVGAPPPS